MKHLTSQNEYGMSAAYFGPLQQAQKNATNTYKTAAGSCLEIKQTHRAVLVGIWCGLTFFGTQNKIPSFVEGLH